jgi:hypothetical protein
MAWAIKQEPNGGLCKLILLLLANYADESGSCFPTQVQLAEQAGCSLRSVKYALQHLRDCDLLTDVRRRRKDGTQAASRYQLSLKTDRVQILHPDPPIRVQKTTGQSANGALYYREDTITKPITKEGNPNLKKKWETLRQSLELVINDENAPRRTRVAAHAK